METIFNFKRILVLGLALGMCGCQEVSFQGQNPAPNSPDTNTGTGTQPPVVTEPESPFEKVEESYIQNFDRRQIDILFVDDNSLSMHEEQEKLGTKIGQFLKQIADLDWQIGITTTDVSDGPYGLKGELLPFAGTNSKILTPFMPDYENLFLGTIVRQESFGCVVPNCPSGDEQGLKAAGLAISKGDDVNAGFFRPHAKLAVVFLSDEDEESYGPEGSATADDFLRALNIKWGGRKDVSAYGIIIEPDDADCFNQQVDLSGNYGTRVADLAAKTNGFTASICAADYGLTLAKIGDSVRKLINRHILRRKPQEGSLVIEFDPAQPQAKYKLEDDRVTFTVPPPAGTKVKIKYLTKK